jgi:hypothetical protein
MALKGRRRQATTSRYLIESREAEQKLAEARKKRKMLRRSPAHVNARLAVRVQRVGATLARSLLAGV